MAEPVAIEAKLTELIGPVVGSLPEAERPAVIALAERIAAGRYRGWIEHVEDPEARARLAACADREEEIASRVEAIVPDAAGIQAAVKAAHPDLPDGYAALFEGRPLAEQFALQARAERAGAALWRSLAQASEGPARAVFLECAKLEEESAEVLESLKESV